MDIICEIGSNWKTLDDCILSVKAAKECGATAVKFQHFTSSELTGVAGGVFSLPAFGVLSTIARQNEIEFMCTAFSPYGYHAIDPHVQRHKIASSELTDKDILRTVSKFRKPVLLSTGGATFDQIDEALDTLLGCPVTLLFCVTDYPARIIDFRHLEAMKGRYGKRVRYGYSDHSCDVLNVPSRARDLGCLVIEKHVNFTRHRDTPDAPHSLNKEEFTLMVKNLRGEATLADTFRRNPWQRRLMMLIDGTSGYFRPIDVG